MNSQIKNLAEQAGFQYIKDENIGWAGNYNSSLEKFAELLLSKVLDTVVNVDLRDVIYTTHDKAMAQGIVAKIERNLLEEFNITDKV